MLKTLGRIWILLVITVSAIEAQETIRVGVFNSEPLIEVGEQGQPRGLFIDLVEHIAQIENWKIQYVPGSWNECFERAKSGEVDLAACIAYSDERTALFDYTKDHVFLDWGVIFQAKGGRIESLYDLQGKTISCMKGSFHVSAFKQLMEPFHLQYTLLEEGESEKAIQDVESGLAYAAICTNVLGLKLQDRYSVERTGIVFSPVRVMFAVRKGTHPEIIRAIDRQMAELKADRSSFYWQRYNYWLGSPRSVFPAWAVWTMVGGAVALLVLISFAYFLRRQVRVKTNDLRKTIEQLRISEVHSRELNATLETRVSERTNALTKAMVEAAAASRAKSNFLSNMSHEIRTPLNAILGYSHLLKRDQDLSSKQHESIMAISRSGEHLLDLISDILDMSKIESGRTTLDDVDFDLHALIRSMESMFKLRVQEKGLRLVVQFAEGLPTYVRADQRKLRQILFNLLSNAVKFTIVGAITLRASVQPQSQSAAPGIARLEFEVEDTGPGISLADQALLFQPFSQTESGKGVHGGTGLGLAICKGFVEAMGGVIGLRSSTDSGSCFVFTICSRTVEQPRLLISPQPVLRLRSGAPPIRVLIVDDHAESRRALSELLQTVGFLTREAVDGENAVHAWEEWKPQFVWMDMQMPILDGYRATQEICKRDTFKQTIIVALTASAFEEDRERILSSGCSDCLTKPVGEDAIFACMAKHLHVEFEYESREATPLQFNTTAEEIIAGFIELSPACINEIRAATRRLDAAALEQIIPSIVNQHPTVAAFLSRTAQQLDFDALHQLLSRVGSKSDDENIRRVS